MARSNRLYSIKGMRKTRRMGGFLIAALYTTAPDEGKAGGDEV
jgi:hypothetical protein